MKKAISLALIALLVVGIVSFAVTIGHSPQPPEPSPKTKWIRVYGGDNSDAAFCSLRTEDGGYALAGSTMSSGVGLYDVWLIKVDASGNVEWNRTWGGVDHDEAYSVIQTGDGGYALAGYTKLEVGNNDAWLIKVDSNGNHQWNKTYGGAYGDCLYSVLQTEDGGYALAGFTESFDHRAGDVWLIKVDASGNMEWQETYGGTNTDRAQAMVRTDDGGYLLAGYTFSFGAGSSDMFLVKFDSSGIVEWSRWYGGPDSDAANSVVQTSDGGFILAGDEGGDAWLVKVDAGGNHQWNKTWGGMKQDDAFSVLQTKDDGYVLAGYTRSFGADDEDGWLIKSDPDGNEEWNQTYGGPGFDDALYSVIQISDGQYALSGFTASFAGTGFTDAWLIKVARTSVHNVDTGLDYATIQEAIDAPETLDGQTIRVDAGTYHEHVTIHKSLSLIGEDRSTTVIDANLIGTVINITADNIKITNFTIKNSGSEGQGGVHPDCGIDVDELSGNNISYNIITNNRYGIWLYNSSDNIVWENNITANNLGINLGWSSGNIISGNDITANGYGFNLANSPNNTITENDITANPAVGIWLQISSNNIVSGNNITESKDRGIELRASSNNNTISGNDIATNYDGMVLEECSCNNISGNNITSNVWTGLKLYNSSNNNIIGNRITNEYDGIYMYGSSSNIISRNEIASDVTGTGISLLDSSDNSIHHNNFDNTKQVDIDPGYPSLNTWDDGAEGNYWSDYKERYPDAESLIGTPRWNSTPTWNTPYVINQDNHDDYPLVFRWCREDIYCDGKINILDITIVAQAYGSYPGHERWNSRADINGDKNVNILDIAAVAAKFNMVV